MSKIQQTLSATGICILSGNNHGIPLGLELIFADRALVHFPCTLAARALPHQSRFHSVSKIQQTTRFREPLFGETSFVYQSQTPLFLFADDLIHNSNLILSELLLLQCTIFEHFVAGWGPAEPGHRDGRARCAARGSAA